MMSSEVVSTDGPVRTHKTVFCRNCGQQIQRTAPICSNCGGGQRLGCYRNKVVAGVVAILIGGLGVHRFYLGQWWGLFYLLLFWTVIPGLISIVEGIVFLVTKQQKWDDRFNEGVASAGESSGAILVLVLVPIFVVVPVIGILAAIAIPAYQDFSVKAKVQEGVNLANPHRTAAGIACSEGSLQRGLSNSDFGLREPSAYSGTYTASVTLAALDQQTVDVVVNYRAIGTAVSEGQTVVYTGTCQTAGMVWEVSGSIARKFQPKI